MFIRLAKRAQTTAEYAIVIALVIGAVVAMQVYVRRGLQGRVREVVDHTGAGGSVGDAELKFSGSQYEPYYLTSDATSTQQASATETLQEKGAVARTSQATSTAARTQTITSPD